MNSKARLMVAVLAAASLLAGCKKGGDDYEPSVVPKTFAFEGQVEVKYAGTWRSSDGSNTLELAKDGGLNIKTVTRSVAGKSVSTVSGLWLAKGNNLVFKYSVRSQPTTVVSYSATLSGSSLTLAQSGGRIKTTYQRS